MRKICLIFLMLLPGYTFACICNPIVPISTEACEKYDAIFFGTVDSVGPCGDQDRAIAYFTINDLFKGKVRKAVEIYYDCNTECLMNFAANDEWLIYATYSKFDHLEVSICEHSRKKATEGVEDFYALAAQRTFAEELKYLKENLKTQEPSDPIIMNTAGTELGRHNEQPSAWGKVVLLLISVGAMVGVYFVTRRKK